MGMSKTYILSFGVILLLGVASIIGVLHRASFTPATIGSEEITETYFSGSVATIHGTSVAALRAQAELTNRLDEFRAQANEQVPALHAQFGPEVPAGHYEITLSASVVESADTETIVISEYRYTGGANGMSTYTTFTSPQKGGSLIALADIVLPEQKEAFTDIVRTKLQAWAEEREGAMLFTEDVAALTFDSFTNWSVSDEALTIYFDKYAVGPGALGTIELTIPRTELADFLF